MKCVPYALAIGCLAACATDQPERAAAQESDPSKGNICTYEVPIGSSIKQRKCTTPEERALQRSQAAHDVVYEPGARNAR